MGANLGSTEVQGSDWRRGTRHTPGGAPSVHTGSCPQRSLSQGTGGLPVRAFQLSLPTPLSGAPPLSWPLEHLLPSLLPREAGAAPRSLRGCELPGGTDSPWEHSSSKPGPSARFQHWPRREWRFVPVCPNAQSHRIKLKFFLDFLRQRQGAS